MAHSVDKVTIANLALSHLGTRSTIESFDEASPQAQQAKLWYDFSREQALAVANWNFARKRVTLAAHSDAPPDTWVYRYQYPTDCLKARYIENPVGPEEDLLAFKVETSADGSTQTILTDQESAVLVYTFDQTLAVLFSPFFVMMLSYLLAHNMAMSLTGKATMRTTMLEMFIGLSLQAPANDANEGIEREPRDAEHIRGR